MTPTKLNQNWEEQKSKLKQKFAVLTDTDLVFIFSKKEEMMGRLQLKLGKTRAELQHIIAGL